VKIRKCEYQKIHNQLQEGCMRLEQYGGHPLWKDSESIVLYIRCVGTSISLPGIRLTPGRLVPDLTAADAKNKERLALMLEIAKIYNQDFSAVRRHLIGSPSDHYRLAVGTNVQNGFIPNMLAEADRKDVVLSPCKFELDIDSAMYNGCVSASLRSSVFLLMDEIKQHTTQKKKVLLFAVDFKRGGKTKKQLSKMRNAATNKMTLEKGALKSILPLCVLRRLGAVSYVNIQKEMITEASREACKAEQRSTMFRLTWCAHCILPFSRAVLHLVRQLFSHAVLY